jgi:large subunit ribosomal protein L3
MALKLMGKKRGMMQLFDEQGNTIVCTVIEAEPNVVTQIKTKATDGYEAVQIGFEKVKGKDSARIEERTSKPLRGHFKKANVPARRYLNESRLDKASDYQLGQELGVGTFTVGTYVDVTGQSKGKGFQGTMKLHNFRGGPASHGSSFHRHAGSTGMRTTPGRCFPGGKRASHMGDERVTVQNLLVVLVNEEEHLILVSGAVPGANGSLVSISQAKKQRKSSKPGKVNEVKLWQN